jgi:hypothetical protein
MWNGGGLRMKGADLTDAKPQATYPNPYGKEQR